MAYTKQKILQPLMNSIRKRTQDSGLLKNIVTTKKLNFYTDYNFKKQEKNKIITPAGMYPFCIFNRYPEGMQTLGKKQPK